MKKIIIVLICFAVINISVVFSENVGKSTSEIRELEQTVQLLEERVNYSEKYYDKSLENMKFVFSIFAGLITIVFGGMGYFTLRISDREIKAIKEELKNEHIYNLKALENQNEQFKIKMEENIKIEIQKISKDFNERINSKLDRSYSSLDERIKILNVELIYSQLDFNSERFSIYKCSELISNAKGIFQVEWRIGEVLEKIEAAQDSGRKFDVNEHEDLMRIFKNVPSEYQTIKERIELKLKQQ